MKRLFALVVLLAALGVLFKLALKPGPAGPDSSPADAIGGGQGVQPPGPGPDPREEVTRRYARVPSPIASLVDRVLKRYSQTAVAIERTDGLRGLRLLDRLDLEAVYLYEKHPKEFRSLRDLLDDDAAADDLAALAGVFRAEAGR